MNSSDIGLGVILDGDEPTAVCPQPWNVRVALSLPDRAYLRRLIRELASAGCALDPRVRPERADLDNVVRVMVRAQSVVQLIEEAASARFHADAASELERALVEREQ